MSDCKRNDSVSVQDLTKVPSAQRTDLQQFSVNHLPLSFDPNTVAAQIGVCVSANYNNGQITVTFPVIGSITFNVNLPIPSPSTVQVCMSTCGFKLSPPFFNGINATVSYNGNQLWSGTIWGSC